jgi:hypothetical protein
MFASLVGSAAAMVVASGCVFAGPGVKGSGNARTETRSHEQFDRVAVRGVGEVNIVIGAEHRVTVTADDNLLPIYTSSVVSGELVLEPSESIQPKTPIRVEIVMPALRSASIVGSGDLNVTGLAQKEVEFKIAGSGELTGSGSVETVSTSIKGSGSIRLPDLAVRDATVSISGSGETVVNASENLSASISGSGDVRYVGNPKNVQKSISGAGEVAPAQKS